MGDRVVVRTLGGGIVNGWWHWSGLFNRDGNDFYLTCSSSGIGGAWVTDRDSVRATVRVRVRLGVSVSVSVATGLGLDGYRVRVVRGTDGSDSDVAIAGSLRIGVGVGVCAGLRAAVIPVTSPITVV